MKTTKKKKPIFQIRKDRLIECTSHHNYLENKQKYEDSSIIKTPIVTCHTCDYYKSDQCEIPSETIRHVIKKHEKGKIKCVLCADKIESFSALIYSQYLSQKENIHLDLLCCQCFNLVKKEIQIKSVVNKRIKRKLGEMGGGLLIFTLLMLEGGIKFLTETVEPPIVNIFMKSFTIFILALTIGLISFELTKIFKMLRNRKKYAKYGDKYLSE